jgi:hypothetical protein
LCIKPAPAAQNVIQQTPGRPRFAAPKEVPLGDWLPLGGAGAKRQVWGAYLDA